MINKRKEKWSEEKKLQFKKKYIKGKNNLLDVEKLSIEEIQILFHNLKVESVNRSQEKRVKTIKNKGCDEWSNMTKKGQHNRKIKFLIENNIIDTHEKLEKKDIDYLFLLFFNKISKHGEKIKSGRKEKHGINYKESFRQGLKQSFQNFCNLNNLDLTPENYDELYILWCKRLSHDVNKWKKSHLDNRNIEYDENNFKEKYNEYIRDRFEHLLDTLKNGYKRSKKGWFLFSNGLKFFYRSSWELRILENLNILMNEGKLEYIKVPERIVYYIDNYRHYYFPDIEYKLYDNNRKILEIKPNSKINENLLKLDSAKKKYGNNFIIITEKEIYNDELKIILEKYGKI